MWIRSIAVIIKAHAADLFWLNQVLNLCSHASSIEMEHYTVYQNSFVLASSRKKIYFPTWCKPKTTLYTMERSISTWCVPACSVPCWYMQLQTCLQNMMPFRLWVCIQGSFLWGVASYMYYWSSVRQDSEVHLKSAPTQPHCHCPFRCMPIKSGSSLVTLLTQPFFWKPQLIFLYTSAGGCHCTIILHPMTAPQLKAMCLSSAIITILKRDICPLVCMSMCVFLLVEVQTSGGQHY